MFFELLINETGNCILWLGNGHQQHQLGIGLLITRCKRSINFDAKRKLTRERWLTPKLSDSPADVDSSEKEKERNVHVKLEMKEKVTGMAEKREIVDYRVLGIYTKTYNKWYPCEFSKQKWKKGIEEGKYRVLLWMIQFDYLMGKWKNCKPDECLKWTKTKSFYVLYDASSISEVAQKLSVR